MERAIADMQAGNNEKAIADLTEVIKLQPNNADAAYFLCSNLKVTSGDTAGALADLNKGIELEPRNSNARVERGVIPLLQGKSHEAQAEFDLLLKSDPLLWRKRIDEKLATVKTNCQPARTRAS